MYARLRKILFRLDPERAHALSLSTLRWLGSTRATRHWLTKCLALPPSKPVHLWGLHFPNRIGLAAGYDKDALAFKGLACLGFGHIEIGTVTPMAQSGNARPRLFRIPDRRALLNHLGFPSRGASFVAHRLERRCPLPVVLGVNIGKNRHTPLEHALYDYLALLRRFAPLADYLVINISSPNTPGLRKLQRCKALAPLLKRLVEERDIQSHRLARPVPLLIKLSPDLESAQLEALLEQIDRHGIDGVVATNTASVEGRRDDVFPSDRGGLSGELLAAQSTEMIHRIATFTRGKLPIIGVGGLASASELRDKLEAGASLIQLYTGLIYRGPALVRELLIASLDASAESSTSPLYDAVDRPLRGRTVHQHGE